MKKLIYTIACFALLFSCTEDLEDINTNPNEPEVVPTNTIFNSATKQLFDNYRNSFSSGRLTLPWMQYWTQNSYADEDRYLYRETTSEGIYETSYIVATDLKSIIDLNTDEETREQMSAFGNNENQIAASRIMLSFIFHRLVDFFGDVPYWSYGSDDADFEGLDVDGVLSPNFAPQEKIYMDILNELKEAAEMIDTSQPVFTGGDNIYNGDATKWKKFANSLRLRVANRLRLTDPATAESVINEALASGVMESNEDNAVQAYEAADATASPMWVAFIGRTDFGVASPFVAMLKGQTGSFGPDPRLFQMAAPISASIDAIKSGSYEISENYDDYLGLPYAFPQAQSLPFSSYSFPSGKVLSPDYGEVLMEYAEVAFIISEHNDWDETSYQNGVRASMERWGVPAADIDTFVSGLPAAIEETVLNQKYVALYMQPHEAWANYRRTGYPSTLVLPGGVIQLPQSQVDALPPESRVTEYIFEPREPIDDLPTRLRYPIILQTLNGENYTEAVSQLEGGDTIESLLFWDSK